MSQKYIIDKETEVVCVKAASFPDGIGGAWQKLFSSLPFTDQRQLYGISHGDGNGNIVYRAAAEELHDGEAREVGFETFIIRKGEYIGELLQDWKKDETQIGRTFQKLLKDHRIAKEEGYCLEMYLNEKDVRCMVLLDPSMG